MVLSEGAASGRLPSGQQCCCCRYDWLMAGTDAWLRDENIQLDSWQASHLLEDKRNTGRHPPGTFSSNGNPSYCRFHLSLSHFRSFVRSFMISLYLSRVNSKLLKTQEQMFKNTSRARSSASLPPQIPGWSSSIIMTKERHEAESKTLCASPEHWLAGRPVSNKVKKHIDSQVGRHTQRQGADLIWWRVMGDSGVLMTNSCLVTIQNAHCQRHQRVSGSSKWAM